MLQLRVAQEGDMLLLATGKSGKASPFPVSVSVTVLGRFSL